MNGVNLSTNETVLAINESLAPRPKTFTPRKSNPRKLESTAKQALKQGFSVESMVRKFGVEELIKGCYSRSFLKL